MEKILIVDDSVAFRLQLKKILESEKYVVVEGSDGIKGLEALEKNPDVKLVLCDVYMPDMNGIEMVEKVRENSKYQSLPICIITTESSMEMKRKGLKLGVLAWITKPYDGPLLLKSMRKILDLQNQKEKKVA